MGSFLTRCNVTQQIISDDERVRFVPIIAQSETQTTTLFRVDKEGAETLTEVYPPFDHTIYFNAFWTPFGRFMTGTYADYGRFKLDETDENKATFGQFLLYLQSLAYGTKEGENSCHDLPVNITALIREHLPNPAEPTWEGIHELWEAIHDLNHDNRIYVRNNVHRGPPRLLATAVISEEAWQALSKGATASFNKGWKEIEEGCADREAFVSAVLDRSQRLNADGTPKEYDEEYRKGYFEFLIKEKLERMYGRGEGEYNLIRHAVESYDAARMLDEGEPLDKVRALITPSVEEHYIKQQLSDLGVKLVPHGYAGQDYGNHTGMTLNVIALRVMIAKQKARDIYEYGEGFLDEVPEEDEDAYVARDRRRAALFQKLETLVDELASINDVTEDDSED